MSKLPNNLNNPWDNVMMSLCDKLCPLFKSLNFTPNMLTTLSLITGLGSVYFFNIKNYNLSSLLFIVSYFFDCIDGYYARKYNMVSKFGDYYDHTKDVIVTSLIIFIIVKKYWNIDGWQKFLPFVLIIFVPFILAQVGCVELLRSKNKKSTSDSLSITQKLCPARKKKEIINIMKYTKFGTSGSSVLYISALIFYTQFLNI
jgi:phosphatidylglycerophosphate synthase